MLLVSRPATMRERKKTSLPSGDQDAILEPYASASIWTCSGALPRLRAALGAPSRLMAWWSDVIATPSL